MSKMTEQQKAAKYGMKWFVKTFKRKPMTPQEERLHKTYGKKIKELPVTYEVTLARVYALIETYKKSEVDYSDIILDLENLIQPVEVIQEQPEKYNMDGSKWLKEKDAFDLF